MNFNGNSYGNYPYYGGGPGMNSYMQPQQVTQIPQTLGLNGKIVESLDIVNVTEVPIGGYGVFPKADLSEIYVKTWNPQAKKMDTLVYKITTPEAIPEQEDVASKIIDRINDLEQKLNAAIAGISVTTSSHVEEKAPVAAKKEGAQNVF